MSLPYLHTHAEEVAFLRVRRILLDQAGNGDIWRTPLAEARKAEAFLDSAVAVAEGSRLRRLLTGSSVAPRFSVGPEGGQAFSPLFTNLLDGMRF